MKAQDFIVPLCEFMESGSEIEEATSILLRVCVEKFSEEDWIELNAILGLYEEEEDE